MDRQNWDDLIKNSQQGDKAALESVLSSAYPAILYQCTKMLGSDSLAEQAAQSSLQTIVKNLHTLSDPMQFRRWSLRISAAVCLDTMEQMQIPFRTPDSMENAINAESPEGLNRQSAPPQALNTNENTQMLDGFLTALPVGQRICLMLYYFAEMSLPEIATMTGTAEALTANRIYCAKASIKQRTEEAEKYSIRFYGQSPLPYLCFYLRKAADLGCTPAAALPAVRRALSGRRAAAAKPPKAAQPAPVRSSSGGKKWVLPAALVCVLVLVAVGIAVWFFFSSGSAPDHTKAPEKSASAASQFQPEATEAFPDESESDPDEQLNPSGVTFAPGEEPADAQPDTNKGITPGSGNGSGGKGGNSGSGNGHGGGNKPVDPASCPGHQYIYTVIDEPTCKPGKQRVTCSLCTLNTEEEMKPVQEHNYQPDAANSKDPTCNEKGIRAEKCSVCGDIKKADIDRLTHSYTWTTVKEAACTQDGSKKGTCSFCGSTDTQVIPALGHSRSGNTCTRCGEVFGTDDPDAFLRILLQK